MKKIITSIIFLLLPIMSFAHQPNYIENTNFIINSEPEISKAYYGELNGSEVIYEINPTSTIKLYAQILSPKNDGQKDFKVLIIDENQNIISTLATSSENWLGWYEEYAGDWYWRGPSFNQEIPAGKYRMIVSNTENTGKYSLAIGDIESFPIKKFPQIIKELYLVKTKFFNEPWYGIYYGIIGKYLLAISIIATLIIVGLFYLIIRRLKK
jgi:hypothetical protein